MTVFEIIDKLYDKSDITKEECLTLLNEYKNEEVRNYLFEKSSKITEKVFEKKVFVRGLIEYSNYCKNDCFYCGIRKSNLNAERYRLTKEQILFCCETGYKSGFRTFVLQGGEDGYFTDEVMCDIVKEIRNRFPDCAIYFLPT